MSAITSLHEAKNITAEWSDLCNRCPRATFFQRPEWILSWWEMFSPREPWVLAARQNGRLVGLAPFLFYPLDGRRTLAFCAGGISDYLDVLADSDCESAVLEALSEGIADSGWEACDFEPVALDSCLMRMRVTRNSRRTLEPRDVCPALTLPAGESHLPDVVPTRQLSNLRKYRRKAQQSGTVQVLSSADIDWRLLLQDLEQLHAKRWRQSRNPEVASSAGFQQFLMNACSGLAQRGALHVYILRIDGRPAAALLVIDEKERSYCYRTAIDPDFASFSPGVIVIHSGIEDAVRRGKREFDFLRGREPYKYWWGATDRATMRLRLQPEPRPQVALPSNNRGLGLAILSD